MIKAEMLKKENETLPNQLNEEIKNPTMRWMFQIMEGIGIVQKNPCQEGL